MKLKSVILIALIGFALQTEAQVRKYSNEFLAIGVGARGLAMSGAQTATSSDIYGTYYNPSALLSIKDNFQIGLMHAEYFAGIAKFDYGAVGIPLKGGNSALGLSFIRFAVDDIPNTLELYNPDGSIDYDNIKSFSVGDYAFLVSYARGLQLKGRPLSVGGNVKVIYRQAGTFAKAWGFGIDVAAQYKIGNWKFGATARDVTSTFNAWSFSFTDREKEVLVQTGNELPESSLEITVPTFTLGAAYQYRIKEKFGIAPEIAFDLTTDGKRNVFIPGDPVSIDLNFGIEFDYAEIVYLRGGIGNIQKATDDLGEERTYFQPNTGVGLKFRNIALDYAFTDIGNQSVAEFSHVVSLKFGINRSDKNN